MIVIYSVFLIALLNGQKARIFRLWKENGFFIWYYYKRNDFGMNELTEDFRNKYCIYLRNE
ncbi:MAG: hypothetical protein ACI4TW_02380, partial [Prevotella sp.]